MSTYATVREMKRILENMTGWLDKAAAFAAAKKFEPDTMLTWRLAPDMLPFSFQIQTTCDSAKYAASRAAGKESPSHPDTETTVAALKQRIESVCKYLDTFSEKDFAGDDTRMISLPRWEGKKMPAADYVTEHAGPNFFFHATMTYALLRHNGVELGKRDFLGALSYR
ncbi:MAG TPA: DUF1993 domain-containing protein [Kofleriaceae bacterium]|jgi:hypothetical protein